MHTVFPPIDPVWHYTNAGGLLGILDEKPGRELAESLALPESPVTGAFSVWFTDALYLNDPQELIFGRKWLAEAVEQELRTASDLTADDRSDIDAALEWVKDPTKVRESTSGAYVACFSTDGDSLSQWRGYAGGRGYAIAFDRNVIRQMIAPVIPEGLQQQMQLPEREYSQDELTKKLLELAEYSQPRFELVRYGEPDARKFFEEQAREIVKPKGPFSRTHLCQFALALVKQGGYCDEKEARAIVLAARIPLRVQFRSGPMGLLPYVSVSFLPYGYNARTPLVREIRVGPGEDRELRKAAVAHLLKERGIPDWIIRASQTEIDFRGDPPS